MLAVQLLDVGDPLFMTLWYALSSLNHLLSNVMCMCVQTLEHLHILAQVCHLDLTSSNVMLKDDWSDLDVLRVIDFGFAAAPQAVNTASS